MLKIKDNVDLKELVEKLCKKYNYVIEEETDLYYLIEIENYVTMEKLSNGKKGKIEYNKVYQICKDISNINHPLKSRQIRLLGKEGTKYDELLSIWTSWSFNELDMLYDLIKANLVEKVED